VAEGNLRERLAYLEREIADLKRRWPAHSVPPAMIRRLEELEEECDNIRRLLGKGEICARPGDVL